MVTNEEVAEEKLIILGKFIVEYCMRVLGPSEPNVHVVIGGVILEKFFFASLRNRNLLCCAMFPIQILAKFNQH